MDATAAGCAALNTRWLRQGLSNMFTEEQKYLIKRLGSASRWDNLLHDLSVLVPCFIIMGVGLHFESPLTVVVGMIVYAVIRLGVLLNDIKSIPLMNSVFSKVWTHMIAHDAPEDTDT